MIFSNKIYKIIDGQNVSLSAESESALNLYIYNKSLKKYQISTISERSCVFCKEFNGQKIIKLSNGKVAIASNDFITITDEN